MLSGFFKTSSKKVSFRLMVASLGMVVLLTPAAFADLPGTPSGPAMEKAETLAAALHREALDLHARERWSTAE